MSGYYIVKFSEKSYICSTHLGTTGVPVFNFCANENDAHQFEHRAAAEAVAFLSGGESRQYCDHCNGTHHPDQRVCDGI